MTGCPNGNQLKKKKLIYMWIDNWVWMVMWMVVPMEISWMWKNKSIRD